jgi:signal transduction histidine kinase
MLLSAKDWMPGSLNPRSLLAYVADLELEVDRLRRHHHLLRQEVKEAADAIQQHCAASTKRGNAATTLGDIARIASRVSEVLRDLQELPGYHPAHDQVLAIAVRPLAEQVFRSQQRLEGAPEVALRQELETEQIEWFPGRLRHILDNLLSNALRYRDPSKVEAWVRLGLRVSSANYELRVSDNGIGMPSSDRDELFQSFYRSAPARAAELGVGLAVVKLLVEQSGGTLAVESADGAGTSFVALLPRYEVDDFLI